MSKRLLGHDPETGVSTWHDYDPATDETIIAEVQDCEPFLDVARALRNEPEYGRAGIRADWWHVAMIPIGVQYQWLHDHGVNIHDKAHWPAVRRLLNSPDWRYLRTSTGRV